MTILYILLILNLHAIEYLAREIESHAAGIGHRQRLAIVLDRNWRVVDINIGR